MKSKLPLTIFALLLFCITPSLASASAVINSSENASLERGLVGWWTFDGNDMTQNVKDSSGQNNNGALVGFTSTSTAVVKGKIGQALKFDGVNDYVKTAVNLNVSTSFTISAWFRADLFSGTGNVSNPVVCKIRGTLTKRTVMGIDNGKFALLAYSTLQNLLTGSTLTANKWYHGVFTYDGISVRGYLNGTLDISPTAIAITTDTNLIEIGRCGLSSAVYLNGNIDDVRIYNRALSATEIKQLYNLGSARVNQSLPDIESGLVGWWTFDGNDMAQNVKDSSGQNNNGALVGFTSTSTAVVKGKIGQGLKFDGVNDYLDLTPSLNSLKTSSGSISAWVKISSETSSPFTLFSLSNSSTDYTFQVLLGNGATANLANELITIVYDNGSVGNRIGFTTTNRSLIFNNNWHHIVVTSNGSQYAIYLDGVSKTITVGSGLNNGAWTNLNSSNNAYLAVKRYLAYGYQHYYRDSLDDVRIYSRALSATEIKQLYNLGSARVNQSLPDIERGLVGWWTFDGNDMTQNVKDSSGQNNNGALVGFTSTSTAVVKGKIGQALKFDGVNDYVNKPIRIINALPFTLAGWVRSDGTQRGTILSLESNNSTRDVSIGITETGKAYSIFTDGSSFSILTGTSNITNKWTFVVATYNNPNGIHRLYVNGQYDKIATSFVPYSVMINSFSIGRTSTSTPTSYMKGFIDDVRIYSRALSATEIKQLYNLGR